MFRARDKKLYMWYADMKADLNYWCLWLQLPSSARTSRVISAPLFLVMLCTCSSNGVLIWTLLHQGEIWVWEVVKAWSEPRQAQDKTCGASVMLVGPLVFREPGRRAAAMAVAGQDGTPPPGRLDLLLMVRIVSVKAVIAKKGKKAGTEEPCKK